MAHLAFRDEHTRLELNLLGPEVPAVVEFLLGLISARVTPTEVEPEYAGSEFGQKPPGFGHLRSSAPAPAGTEPNTSAEAPAVADVERAQSAVQVVPAPAQPERLLPRTCAREGCTATFQPMIDEHVYCCRTCKTKVANAKAMAQRVERSAAGQVECPECPRRFETVFALAGHRKSHRPKVEAKPLPVLAHTTRVAKAEAAAAPTPKAAPVDRPYACKEPGCGHPCRSQGELASHHRAFHDTRHGLPSVTEVIDALSFPCPEDGCERVYEDENRLVHHRRVIHDWQAVDPVHQLVSSGRHHAGRVG